MNRQSGMVRNRNIHKIKFLLGFVCLLVSAGCAGNSAKDFDEKLGRLGEKGIVLATITSENRLDASDKLQPGAFVISKPGVKEKEYVFYASDHFRVCDKGCEFCLIVMELDEGSHRIASVRGVVLGDFFLPVFEAQVGRAFHARKNEILYIGHIHMVLRKKSSDSEAGAGDPLVVGRVVDSLAIAGTTIDVEINDEFERDMKKFEEAFPNLKGYTVVKRVLQSQSVSYVD